MNRKLCCGLSIYVTYVNNFVTPLFLLHSALKLPILFLSSLYYPNHPSLLPPFPFPSLLNTPHFALFLSLLLPSSSPFALLSPPHPTSHNTSVSAYTSKIVSSPLGNTRPTLPVYSPLPLNKPLSVPHSSSVPRSRSIFLRIFHSWWSLYPSSLSSQNCRSYSSPIFRFSFLHIYTSSPNL